MEDNSQIVIYKTEDDKIELDVQLTDETVWLSQSQMASYLVRAKRQYQNISAIFFKKKN